MVVSRRGVETNTIGKLKPLQEVIIYLELTIEALTLVLVQMVVQNIIGVHDAVRRIVITWRIEGVAQVFQLYDSNVTWSLHDRVVHVLKALSSLHELVLLISIVQ